MTVDDMLTPKQAAALAGVSTSTVKRWAEEDGLPSVRTPGGHRRYVRGSLERWLRERDATAGVAAHDGLIATLVAGRRHEVDARLLAARARLGSWHAVADELGGVLHALGEAWREGRLDVAEEHLASAALARGLARVGDALPTAPDARGVLLASVGDEEHTLGLALAELCVREVGLPTVWLGRGAPVDDVVRAVVAAAPVVVGLSASSATRDATVLARAVHEVGEACRPLGARLVLGGTGPWPTGSDAGIRLGSFERFHRLLIDAGRRAGP